MTEGFTELGRFEHDGHRWRVMRCRTRARTWVELRDYVDGDYDYDGPMLRTMMAFPDDVARQIAAMITQEVTP